jgi:hypothetical protein
MGGLPMNALNTLVHSVVIHAPPGDVQAVAQDARRWPEWYPGVEQAEPDDRFPKPGGRVSLNYRVAGVMGDIWLIVLEAIRGKSTLYGMEGLLTGTSRWVYTPEGEATQLTVHFSYRLPYVPLSRVADVAEAERRTAQNLRTALQNLKSRVEG